MAQWNKTTQTYRAIGGQSQDTTLHEVYMRADQYGNIINEGATHRSAFGEQIAIPITPVIQLDGLYGLQTRNFETFNAFSGSADTTNTLMRTQTGTSQYGYGVIRSRRAVRYRPGQGAICRFTAAFTESAPGVGVAGYTQRAGFFTQEQAIQVGFDGENFGVLRQNDGKAHIEKLTITTGANSSGNVTVTLNGTPYVVPLANTTSNVGITAAEISEWFQANASAAWVVEHCDGIVSFLSTSIGPKNGTYSFVDTGTTGAVASLTTLQSGVLDTNNWTYQDDFNIDKLDGTGPSKVTIDTTKLNIYQINFRWLGAGEIRFAIENPTNGDMIFFHHIHYSNQNTDVHIDNPSLKIGYVAASLGGTGTNVTVTGGSMMGGVEGLIQSNSLPTAALRSTSHNPNLTSSTLHHGVTVHNRLVFNDKINARELLIKSISVSVDTNTNGNPVEVLLFYNFVGLPSPSVYKVLNLTESSAFYNDTVGSMTQGANIPIYAFFTAGQQAQTIDLDAASSGLRIAIPPNNDITLAIRSTDTISRVGVAISFIED